MAASTWPGPEGPPQGWLLAPIRKGLGSSSKTPFQCLCQASQGQERLHFIKNLYFIKN